MADSIAPCCTLDSIHGGRRAQPGTVRATHRRDVNVRRM